ncbi:hypothetical protein NQD34_009058 [Periophthalmus magnuspinnatus]|nr:hypothetical protein NQD34_009058 [Periophthalmus magnuspinnatus]
MAQHSVRTLQILHTGVVNESSSKHLLLVHSHKILSYSITTGGGGCFKSLILCKMDLYAFTMSCCTPGVVFCFIHASFSNPVLLGCLHPQSSKCSVSSLDVI